MNKVIKDVFQDYKKEGNMILATVSGMNLYKKSNKLQVKIESQNQLNIEELADFESYLSQRFSIKTIILEVKYNGIDLNCTIEKDWPKIIKYISLKFPVTKAILKGSKILVNGNSVVIDLKSKSSEFLHAYSVDKVLENLFMNAYGNKYKVTYNENITSEEIEEQQHMLEEFQDNICKNMVQNIAMAVEQNKKAEEEIKQELVKEKEQEEIEEEQTPLIVGRTANIKEQIVKIKDLTSDYGKVALQGKVIKTDSRELKNGKTLVMFDVYDGTSTITCKSFVEPEKLKKVLNRIKKGIRVKLQGNAQYDNFAKEIGVIANIVIELPQQEEIRRMDNSEIKRVELHLHTQMSQMDAVTPAKELIKRAAAWGMKSIAITDHGVVQAFPEAKHAVDDLGLDIKVIYGVEAYFVPDDEIPEGEDGWKKVKPYHAIILTKTQKGLRNLYELISKAYRNIINGNNAYSVTGVSYVDSNCSTSTTYVYTVRAMSNMAGMQNRGDATDSEIGRTGSASYVHKVGTPKIATAENTAAGTATLTWKKISLAKYYIVYRSTQKNGTYSKIGSTVKLTYADKKAVKGKTYYYKVKAVAMGDNGVVSTSSFSPAAYVKSAK